MKQTETCLIILFLMAGTTLAALDSSTGYPLETVIQKGHTMDVTSVAFSPDGKSLASGGADTTIKIWEIATGRLIRTLRGHSDDVISLAFSPNGKDLASGSKDYTIKIWETATGRLLRTISRYTDWIRTVAFSPDGKYLASGNVDEVNIWEAATGRLLRTLGKHQIWVSAVAFSPNGKYLASTGVDSTIKIWDVASGQLHRTLKGRSRYITSLAISPNGMNLANGNDVNTIIIWETTTGRRIRRLAAHSDMVRSLAFSPEGKYLASGGDDQTIRIWEAATGRLIHTFQGHPRGLNSVAFSLIDGKYLVSGGVDNTIKIWEATTGRLIRTLDGSFDDVGSVATHPNGNNQPSGNDEATGIPLRTLKGHTKDVYSVAFSPDGRYALSGSDDNTLKLWEVSSGREIRTFEGHSAFIQSVAFSPDGRQALSGSSDNSLKLWETASGRLVRTFKGHSSDVWSVTFSPDGRQVLSGSADNTLKLWKVTNGRLVQTFEGHSAMVSSVAFSPDGHYALSGSNDETIKLWEVASGKLVRTIDGHSDVVRSVAFSPDGHYALSGSNDNTLKLWELAAGRLVRTFEGHSRFVSSVTFSPDGRYALSGSIDTTLKLWKVANGKLIQTFEGHLQPIFSVAFSPSGRYVLSGSRDNTLKLWEVSTPDISAAKPLAKPAPRHATMLKPDKARQMLAAMAGRRESSQGSISEARYSLLTIKSQTDETPLELVFSTRAPALGYASFSIEDDAIIAGSSDGGIYLWNLLNGRPVLTLSTEGLETATEATTPDSSLLLKAMGSGNLQVRETSSGQLLRTLTGHTGAVKVVDVSPDGQRVTTGGEDGTLRLWELETGRLLITAVVMPDGQWAALTPDGRFDRSEGFVYLQWRKGNKTYALDQFFDEFYTPGLMGQAYQGDLNEVQRNISQVLEAAPPPQVQIVSPAGDGDVDVTADDVINVMVEVSDAGGGVKEVVLYHNGKAVGGTQRGFKRKSAQQDGVTQLNYRVTLLDGENVLWAVAWNLEGISARSEPVALMYEKSMPDRPELYAVIVGLNKYKNKTYSLNYGRPDAESVMNMLRNRGQELFTRQHLWLLYDGGATSESILKALEDVVKQARPEDVFVMYYAGHGVMAAEEGTGRPQFYLAPYSVTQLYDEQMLWKSGISAGQLKILSQRIKARKQVLMLDACESGGALESFKLRGAVQEKALKQLSRSAGTFLLASSQSDQFSAEFSKLRHGAFTYAVLSGLAGQADGGGRDGKITMHELSAYISDQVPVLTESYRGEAQYPTVYAMGDDFPLALGGGGTSEAVPKMESTLETRGGKIGGSIGIRWSIIAVSMVLLATIGYGIWRKGHTRRKLAKQAGKVHEE